MAYSEKRRSDPLQFLMTSSLSDHLMDSTYVFLFFLSKEYVRDCAFDPRRWTAPGQRSIWPSPCGHGLDTTEVPLDSKFFGFDKKLMLGKTCDRGHRWMVSKTISDCVEALIGAYYVGGGLSSALSLMKWLGVAVEVEHSLIDHALQIASLYSYAPKADDIGILESKIDYKFRNKGLLLEATTHATEGEQGVGYCYQVCTIMLTTVDSKF